MIAVRETRDGASFSVRVQPRAKRDAVVGEVGDVLKLALTAPPLEGRANQACVAFLAQLLGVPRSAVQVAAGATSRTKRIRVVGLAADAVRARLASAATGR